MSVGTSSLSGIALAPDGDLLASAGSMFDSVVELWRISDGTRWGAITGGITFASSLAFCPDGSKLVTGGGGGVGVWRLSDGALVQSLPGNPDGTSAVAVSPDGNLIASGGSDAMWFGDGGIVTWENIRLWRVADSTLLRTMNGALFSSAAPVLFSPDGTALASGGEWGVWLWQVSDGMLLQRPASSSTFAFDPSGRVLASGGDGIRFLRVATGSLLSRHDQEAYGVSTLAFSPDNRFLAYGRGDAVLALIHNPCPTNVAPFFRLQATVVPTNRILQLALHGDAGWPCVIQASTNLVNWNDWTNVVSASAPLQVVDASATNRPVRFYRVRSAD
jgi:WD40 repeat protein